MKNDISSILYLSADKGIHYWGSKGSSVHIREFVAALADSGKEISVLARLKKDDPGQDGNARLYKLPAPSELGLLDKAHKEGGNKELLSEIKAFYLNSHIERRLKNIRRNSHFQLIYERYSLFSSAGLKFARKNNIPFVLEVNAPLIKESIRYRKLITPEVAEVIEEYLFTGADAIIAVSDELRKYISGIAPETPVHVIPNGVSSKLFKDDLRLSEKGTDQSNGDKSETVIGFVGRIRPWHGLDILIDAFAELTKQTNGSKLMIIGAQGNMRSELEARVEALGLNGSIQFTGMIPHEEIPQILNKADILVAPYPKLENFYFSSLKLFEYMAAGKAIVASDIGQISGVLKNNDTAILVPPGDSGALADAMLKLINEPRTRYSLGQKARAEALSRHTWDDRISDISDILNNLNCKQG